MPISSDQQTALETADIINNSLNSTCDWLRANKISVNVDKTKYLLFSYKKLFTLPDIVLNDSIIQRTDRIKFLGVVLDEKLNFDHHINYILGKTSKTLGVLYRVKQILPVHIVKSLYSTFILPYFLYGIEVWFGSSGFSRNKIFIQQKRVVRTIAGLPFNHHTSAHFKQLKILKFHDLYERQVAVIMHQSINRDMYHCISSRLILHSNVHSHATRNRNLYAVPRFAKAKSQKSLLYNCVSTWNRISQLFNHDLSLNSFKVKLTDYYLGQY